jgi:hypothetical protein
MIAARINSPESAAASVTIPKLAKASIIVAVLRYLFGAGPVTGYTLPPMKLSSDCNALTAIAPI